MNLTKERFEEAREELIEMLNAHSAGMSYRDIQSGFFNRGYSLSVYQIRRIAKTIPEIIWDCVWVGYGLAYTWLRLRREPIGSVPVQGIPRQNITA